MNASKGFLLALIALLLAVSTLMVLPYLEYLLLAIVLAYVLMPVQRRLEPRTGDRAAAAILSAAATIAVVLPLVFATRAVAAEASALFEAIRAGELQFEDVELALQRAVGVEIEIGEIVSSMAGDNGLGTVISVIDVFGVITHVLIGLGLTLFLLYFFLKDGEGFMEWLHWVVPLPEHVQSDLFESLDSITGAVLAGHVLVAIIQGGIAGIGLFVTSIPNALFWTAVMIVLSLLPIVGSFLVWGPAAAYIFLNGQPVAAAGLVVYGTIVVGVTDDYLRPIVVDRYARVNPSVIIVGVLGGIYVVGFMGIFFGPVLIGMLRVTLEVLADEFGTAESA